MLVIGMLGNWHVLKVFQRGLIAILVKIPLERLIFTKISTSSLDKSLSEQNVIRCTVMVDAQYFVIVLASQSNSDFEIRFCINYDFEIRIVLLILISKSDLVSTLISKSYLVFIDFKTKFVIKSDFEIWFIDSDFEIKFDINSVFKIRFGINSDFEPRFQAPITPRGESLSDGRWRNF